MKRIFGAGTAAVGAAILAVGAAVVVGFGVFGAHGAVPRTGPLSIHAGLKKPPGAVVRGSTLVDEKGVLIDELLARFRQLPGGASE